ncbi:MAG: hypothetical protein OJI67_22980, partial [Prosthecobacter sp.]|nr:hypothetical protein [Prosthecobacter sp.]
MKVSPVILALFSAALTLLLSVSHAQAGGWSTHAWTGDESTGITAGKTAWAYRFGTGEDATVNGVSVPVITTNNASIAGKVAFSNFAEIIAFSDSNNLTVLGGTGSALMASRFTYGGVPMETVTVSSQSLTAGQTYQVSFFSVGWDGDAGDARQVKFVSGADELSVNQNMFGGNHGLRVDYTFTATGGDMTFNIQVDNAMNRTLHLYAVALNQNIVFSTADSGAGSLRDVIAAAPAGSVVTFAPELNGQTITLASQITLTKDVSLDASSLSSGITISGGHATRLFIVNSGQSVAMHSLTLANGQVLNDSGGAIYHRGASLIMTQCSLIGNKASAFGGAIYANGDQTLLQGCTLAENTARRGGSIYSYTKLSGKVTRLEQCTITRNSGTEIGGGIYNYEGLLEIHQCTITDNKAPDEWGAGVCSFGDKLTETRVGNSIVSGNIPSDVDYTTYSSKSINSFVGLGGNIIGDGNAVDEFSKLGGIIGNADPRLARLGDYGGLTQTMPPLAGSAVIDASGTEDPGGTDQRGLPRFTDGNADGTAALDAGAAEARTALIVTTAADSGPGSLRQTIADAPSGSVIYFDETVFLGGESATITYAPGSAQITIDKQLQIDGSNISGGVTLNAAASEGNRKRVMEISHTGDVTLIGLTLTGGYMDGDGGGLQNYGQAYLLRCRLTNNTATNYGGAVFSYSVYDLTQVELRQCSVDGNRALVTGAGLFNWAANSHDADMTLEGCTVTGNETTGVAGGLYNYSDSAQATLNASQCTIANNEASLGGGCLNWSYNSAVSVCELTNCTISGNTASVQEGGGLCSIADGASSTIILSNTIVSGNTASTSGNGPDIGQLNGSITSNGGNFIGKTGGSSVAWLETDQKGTAAAPIDP